MSSPANGARNLNGIRKAAILLVLLGEEARPWMVADWVRRQTELSQWFGLQNLARRLLRLWVIRMLELQRRNLEHSGGAERAMLRTSGS